MTNALGAVLCGFRMWFDGQPACFGLRSFAFEKMQGHEKGPETCLVPAGSHGKLLLLERIWRAASPWAARDLDIFKWGIPWAY